jgi:RNA polymerase sigma-70 factor (ECF subfamily)
MAMMNREEVSNISPLLAEDSDAGLVRAIRNGNVAASTALYDRYIGHVRGVLTRILGVDAELPDLTNETFYQALRSIHTLNDPGKLKAWLAQVAVFTARRCIRGRRRRSRFMFLPRQEMLEVRRDDVDEEAAETAAAVRAVLNRMPTEDRIVFSLKYLGGMDIAELAAACGYSERTAKRRLAGSESRFKALAASDPGLAVRMSASAKWRGR